jgi:hypothetical protein
MSNEDLHPLDAAIEKFKRKRTWPGKRKGYMGRKAHAEGLKWLERHWEKLPEEEKERIRNGFDSGFDSMSGGDVNSK